MRRILTAALLAVLLPASSAAAQERPTGEGSELASVLGDLVPRQLAEDRIPGAVVTVVADGEVVLSEGYGLADVDRDVPVDPDRTTFMGASEAKLFTAVAAAQLIADGRIDPDADVNEYLRAFRIDDTYPGRPVTMNHLLTHTAGFDKDFVGINSEDPGESSPLGTSLGDMQPIRIRPPGEVSAYDNYGMALAGYLVETVSGQPFDEYVADHILKPLGMDRTTFTATAPPDIAADQASGYRPDGDGSTVAGGQYGPWSPTGAGMVLNAADMGTLMIALLDDDQRLGAGVAELVTSRHYSQDPRVPGIAYALVEGEHQGVRTLGKNGDLPGFHHDLMLAPEHDLGVFVGFNGDGEAGAAYWDAKIVREAVLDHLLPSAPADEPVPAEGDVSRYAGTYRASDTSQYSLMKILALTTPVVVEATGDGELSTTGLGDEPSGDTRRWIHVGDGAFAEVGGHDSIAFDDDGVLAGGSAPEAAVYLPTSWYQSPSLHLALLGCGVLGLLAAMCWFPVAALIRRRRGEKSPAPLRAARAAGWLTAVLATVFLVGLGVLMADANRMNEVILRGSTLLTVLPYVAALMVVTTVAMAGCAVLGARKGWWNRAGRYGYAATTTAAVFFLAVCLYYNLVAFGDLVSPGGFHSS